MKTKRERELHWQAMNNRPNLNRKKIKWKKRNPYSPFTISICTIVFCYCKNTGKNSMWQDRKHDWQSWEWTNEPKKVALHKMKWHKSNKWTKRKKRKSNMKWSRSECRNYCSVEHCCYITKIGCRKNSVIIIIMLFPIKNSRNSLFLDGQTHLMYGKWTSIRLLKFSELQFLIWFASFRRHLRKWFRWNEYAQRINQNFCEYFHL